MLYSLLAQKVSDWVVQVVLGFSSLVWLDS